MNEKKTTDPVKKSTIPFMSFVTNELRQTSSLRYLFLFLCCISTFGDYYCFDNVGATHSHLKTQLHLPREKFEYYYSLLYSVYSFPNIILPFIGGLLIALLGLRVMYVVFGVSIIFGQFIFAFGSQWESITLMLIGRVIFGIGGESINICQTAMIVKWYFKSEISFPLGISLTVSRLGSVLNDVLSPRIANDDDATNAYWFGLMLCILSFVAIIILCMIDYAKDQTMKERDEAESTMRRNDGEALVNSNESWIDTLLHFNSLFWVISIICLVLYGTVLPFNYIATGFFCDTSLKSYPQSEAKNIAGIYMGVPFLISALMVPVFGIIIDKFGKRAYITLLSGVLCVLSFVLFYLLEPIIPLIILGLTYSIFAAVIWPSISVVVNNENALGLAYGVTTSLQNLGMAINPIIVAGIYLRYNTYYACLTYFGILGMLAICMSVGLILLNAQHADILNKIEFEEDDKKLIAGQETNGFGSTDKMKENPNYDTIKI